MKIFNKFLSTLAAIIVSALLPFTVSESEARQHSSNYSQETNLTVSESYVGKQEDDENDDQ